ncbi:DUF1351 domain-containing protein [Eggerthella lenta]|uniref:DUF1351 domain-containing protein n=1 Tax=Eggerthella lenta (strain ATCC 25559 / DSM 2243 / CCUG 17323 / JCM 9979 / KCTC 3265 / NCTC 11813 / VPI 0255 / 1899 B) TaxID=479437 RepID=C8WLU0_EGGLE|nr:DUF1351 domain-containing protein [Eggerthella lenta]ACV56553.1 hypothetical protein Elen_2601 [Eggerthella lenta DSM 2243]RDB85187.1 DUF1351 domain-containing protein [Eggerthella lenta]RDB87792.1 DUF1351 domain-containing protein [Eggerthella lenta]RDC10850.1 DUF1351 domain-containing protein [Eggerthella lenta]
MPRAKAADTVEVVEVEAEIIDGAEDQQKAELSVTNKPGSIEANFDALEEYVDGILEDYADWEPSADNAEDVKQCDREKKYLNGLASQLDTRRKAVKSEYLKPLDAFEARANSIRDKIKATAKRLDDVKKQADQAEKDAKYSALEAHYCEFAELLAPVVPYARLHDPKWLNKRPTLPQAIKELDAKVEKVANDWDSLKKRNLEFHDAAEAFFFEHLDLGAACTYNDKLVEDHRRIEELKREMAQEEEAQEAAPAQERPEPAPAPMPAPVPVSAPQPAPAPVVACAPQPMPAPMPEPVPPDAGPYVMVINLATLDQIQQIGRFSGSIGVTGVFKRGTLQEAYMREAGGVGYDR